MEGSVDDYNNFSRDRISNNNFMAVHCNSCVHDYKFCNKCGEMGLPMEAVENA